MGNALTVLKYVTVIIPLMELIIKQVTRLCRTIKSANANRREKKKTAIRERLETKKIRPGTTVLTLLFCLLFAGCASPIFDAVRAQLPQQATDIEVNLEGFIKADVIYQTADGGEGHLSLVCEVVSTDLTGDIGLIYRCPIIGNQFGLEVAYLELDGTGEVLNIRGFDNLIYSVDLKK